MSGESRNFPPLFFLFREPRQDRVLECQSRLVKVMGRSSSSSLRCTVNDVYPFLSFPFFFFVVREIIFFDGVDERQVAKETSSWRFHG